MHEMSLQEEICSKLWKHYPEGMWWLNPTAGFFDGERFRPHASKFALRGTADILGLLHGVFYAFEVKRPEELAWWHRHREHSSSSASKKWQHFARQEAFLAAVRSRGGRAAMVDCFSSCQKIIVV